MSFIVFPALLGLCAKTAGARPDYQRLFQDRDACFLLVELQTNRQVTEHNVALCDERRSPYSTFKIPASLMAFNEGVFKDERQVIPWDGMKRGRAEIDQDLTPLSFMSASAKWVTEWLMPQIGRAKIGTYLQDFKYGNEDFGGGLKDAWVSSTLQISASEQIDFLKRLWRHELKVSKKAAEQTRAVMKIEVAKGLGFELWGKTGTGCVRGHTCLKESAPMFGWFVGVVRKGERDYIFAGHAKDLKPQKAPGGPRQRDTTIEILRHVDFGVN